MSAPVVPPPPVPPPPNNQGNNFFPFKLGTLIFLFFMLIIGGAILISRFTGLPTSTLNNSASNALAARSPGPKVGTITPTPHLILVPTPTIDPTIKVFVTGEVANPGVYIMKTGDRVEDAIEKAGGFTEKADEEALDLAQRVKDEMKIVVPVLPAASATPQPGGITLPPTEKALTPTGKISVTPGKVNVNTASQAELESLPGIGPVLAQRIIDYRAKNGPFKTLDELRKVQGLTRTVLDKIKDRVIF